MKNHDPSDSMPLTVDDCTMPLTIAIMTATSEHGKVELIDSRGNRHGAQEKATIGSKAIYECVAAHLSHMQDIRLVAGDAPS